MTNFSDYMAFDDGQLVALWQAGEERAFRELYGRHFPALYKLAILKIEDRMIAEELVQDVFVSFWRRKHSLYQVDVSGYLFIALRNKIFNHLRDQLTEKRRLQIADDDPDGQTTGENMHYLETRELLNTLRQHVDKLPPQCRTVFMLSREHQLSNKEIARQLNISVKAVEYHISKALRVLRGSLNEYELMIVLLTAKVIL